MEEEKRPAEEVAQIADTEAARAAEHRRGGLVLRLCISVVALAAAAVVRIAGGPAATAAVAGAVSEDHTLTAAFAELAEAAFGRRESAPSPAPSAESASPEPTGSPLLPPQNPGA